MGRVRAASPFFDPAALPDTRRFKFLQFSGLISYGLGFYPDHPNAFGKPWTSLGLVDTLDPQYEDRSVYEVGEVQESTNAPARSWYTPTNRCNDVGNSTPILLRYPHLCFPTLLPHRQALPQFGLESIEFESAHS